MDTDFIRTHFLTVYPAGELVQWFDPLSFVYEKTSQCCTVVFPHKFFADWFFHTSLEKFKKGLETLPNVKNVRYALETATNVIQEKNPERTRDSIKNKLLGNTLPLNSAQNFSNFITNKKNRFQVQAAHNAIQQFPAIHYNPVVITGSSGTGKTHLLNAMANSLQGSKTLFFHGKAVQLFGKNIDVLTLFTTKIFFIDDLQAIKESTKLQQNFLHFFDHAQAEQVLVTVCIDSHPATYAGLPGKIRMRLTGGLILELKKPDLSIRLKYILHESEQQQLRLGKETALSLAQRHSDFRAINGALATLQAYQQATHNNMTELPHILETGTIQNILSPKDIIRQVAKYYNISAGDITGKKRNKNISQARQIAIFLCRELTGITLAQVGEFFGGRDHSSIVYTVKKIQSLQQSNKDMNNQITQLKRMCLNSPWN